MPALFSKPIESLTAQDIQELIGWPETQVLEFKQALATKDGRDDAWLTGGKLGEFARDKLLKEVVALANTSGGHIVLGMAEDRTVQPRTAKAINPILRCGVLAERLGQMAQHIDPPIPGLLVQGVPTEDDAGVVVVRVPESRAAPHRALDLECYVRRGSESVPVSMREIQDMTLAASRRGDRLDSRLAATSAQFRQWLPEAGVHALGFRISALPTSGPLGLGRLYGRPELVSLRANHIIQTRHARVQAHSGRLPTLARAIVRGVRLVYQDEETPVYLEAHSDGLVNMGFRTEPRDDGTFQMYIGWIIGYLLNVLELANKLRTLGGMPDCEYAVEVEINRTGRGPIVMRDWTGGQFQENQMGRGLRDLPLVLPRVSFGPMSELDRLMSMVATDVHDAAGDFQPQPVELSVVQAS